MKKHKFKKRPVSTRSRESSGERFSRLAAMGEQVFHADDLANLWGIRNKNTLHMTLARYVAQGLLHRIQKGFYSMKKPSEIDPYLLGVKALHGPAYISCETVLFDNGIINQPSRTISLVSGMSRRFMLAGHNYHSRKLADAFLVNDAGISVRNGVRVASAPRAVADMLYFNPKKYFDVPSAVQWNQVRGIMRAVGYPLSLIQRYDTSKQK